MLPVCLITLKMHFTSMKDTMDPTWSLETNQTPCKNQSFFCIYLTLCVRL